MKSKLDRIADMLFLTEAKERFFARQQRHAPDDPCLFTAEDLLQDFQKQPIEKREHMTLGRLQKWLTNSLSAELLPLDENRLNLEYQGEDDFRKRLYLWEVDTKNYFVKSIIPGLRRDAAKSNGGQTQIHMRKGRSGGGLVS